jgi:hypothetical protein
MKMSVTRALAELKRIDERLSRDIASGVFVSVTIGRDTNKKMLAGGESIEKVSADIQSSFDTIESAIKRRSQIKASIVKSNAVTLVHIGQKDITVAEAIELKASVQTKTLLLNALKGQIAQANRLVESQAAKLEQQIETNLSTIYGSEKGKIDDATYATIAKPQLALKEPALLDPMKVADRIKSLEDEIDLIQTELDYALSEVNAKTEIEV